MDIGSAFIADAQTTIPVQPAERALDDPPHLAEAAARERFRTGRWAARSLSATGGWCAIGDGSRGRHGGFWAAAKALGHPRCVRNFSPESGKNVAPVSDNGAKPLRLPNPRKFEIPQPRRRCRTRVHIIEKGENPVIFRCP